MTHHCFDTDVRRIEQELQALLECARHPEPDRMTETAARLQEESIALLQRAQSNQYPAASVKSDTVARLREISQGLSRVREHLLRSGAYVDQAVSVVFAAPVPSKYASQSTRYSAVPRQSGEFKVVAA